MSALLDAARAYLRRKWMPVYVPPRTKRPVEKDWQNQRLTEADLPAHFDRPGNIGLILGEPSGGLVDVDLDCPEALELADQYLPPTPSMTGRKSTPRSHRWYISDVPATKQFHDPKTRAMIVELRSTGGQTLVGPSIHDSGEPYDYLEGEPVHVPPAMLEACVKALYEAVVRQRYGETPQTIPAPQAPSRQVAIPEDLLERRASAYLLSMSPAVSGQGGHAATYTAATVLVHGFSLDPERALQLLMSDYNPRCQPPWTEKELRHKVEDAAAKSHDKPFGWLRDQQMDLEQGVDLSAFTVTSSEASEDEAPSEPIHDDPGPLPEELLRVPGFVSEVMDHCLQTAPYPNTVMAFCGALSLQAFLAGRKVCDPGDNRTNLYLLGLAHSAAGKDWPRKLNTKILHQVGLSDSLGERFASGEGVQDALFGKPCMLFQTDEIDGMLQSINKAKDARHENVMSTLLTMYSAANSVFPMRRKAGKDSPGSIDQPCLVIFGTAIPNHYYEALSDRMLTNGFFARMLILESGPRPEGQEPVIAKLPPRVLATAKWWADFTPGNGNLEHWHPIPLVIEHTTEARTALIETRQEADGEYAKAEEKSDAVSTTVWGRVSEQTRKLSLLYAISENHESPRISLAAVEWARAFVMHHTRRMLFMARLHVAENPFHAECLKLIRKLHDAGGQMQRQHLLRAMRCKAADFEQLISTLMQQGELEPVEIRTRTKPAQGYRAI